jgi:predicted site-specific integrase-resolvase
MSRLLTPQELAVELRVTPATVLRWRREGLIPSEVATDKVVRFDLESVRAALKKEATR